MNEYKILIFIYNNDQKMYYTLIMIN